MGNRGWEIGDGDKIFLRYQLLQHLCWKFWTINGGQEPSRKKGCRTVSPSLHRLVESFPWNKFLSSIKVTKFGSGCRWNVTFAWGLFLYLKFLHAFLSRPRPVGRKRTVRLAASAAISSQWTCSVPPATPPPGSVSGRVNPPRLWADTSSPENIMLSQAHMSYVDIVDVPNSF